MASRLKNSINNIFFGFLSKFVQTLFPFFIRSLFIKKIGIDCLGLTNLCTSILGVLSLADLGFAGVIVFFMYKPVAENDTNQVALLLNYFKKIYRVVGLIILFCGLVILPFLKSFIHGDVPANVNVYIVFLIYLLNSVISYFLFAYKSSILNANQRLDIENKLSTVVSLITYFAQTLILLLCSNIYVYLIVLPLSTTILNIIRAKIVDRLFPSENFIGKLSAEERKDIRTKVLATFFFKIDSIVIKMADSIVISSFLGLVTLANYNNYFLILNGIMGFLEVIQSSIRPSIGNSIVSESVEKNYFDMKKLFFVFSYLLILSGSCFLTMYQPFISLWIGDEYLLPYSTVIWLVVYFYAWYFILPVNIYKDANGFWNQDRFRPLIEAPFNLILNIILVKIIGLNGVLISTIATIVFISFPVIYFVMNKYYFIGKVWDYSKKTMKYVLTAILINTLCVFICSFLNISGLLKVLFSFVISIGVTSLVYLLLFFRTEEFFAIKCLIKDKVRRSK